MVTSPGGPPATEEFRQALRGLLLPVSPLLEEDLLVAAVAFLDGEGLMTEDRVRWVEEQLEAWREANHLPTVLAQLISQCLTHGAPEIATGLRDYGSLHADLMQTHGLTFDEALAFLSHARLAFDLAQKERMSAAQVASVLGARDRRISFSWQAVQRLLAALGVEPALDLAAVKEVFSRDRDRESLAFADSDDDTAAALVGVAADRLGFPGDLGHLLRQLAPSGATPSGPYLQILHWAAMIGEFYDHPLSWPYEFSPRGVVGEWLFTQYPSALTAAGNPILNNAKSIDRLDTSWARTRGRRANVRPPLALAQILLGAESLGFHNRRGVSEWLRLWLMRAVRLFSGTERLLEPAAATADVTRALSAVTSSATHTAGVIEQRIVDALSSLKHPTTSGWRSRGIGESVNASNLSAKKFGDCEYLDVAKRELIAYEAHGGTLSGLYVEGHCRTLARVLAFRREELEAVADMTSWHIEVVFVAQSVQSGLPTSRVIEGARFHLRYLTFADLAPAVTADVVEAFTRHVHLPLNERRTPQSVRAQYVSLSGVAFA
jgi:hypothetical protein